MSRPRTIAVIPARYASQRLPGKPLADIAGRPMIVHVLERAREATLVDEAVVATDDERIAAAVRKHGGTAVMTPRDCASGTDRIAWVMRTRSDVDIVVNVQGDEPMMPPSMIDLAVGPLLGNPSIEVATLVRRARSEADMVNPNIPKVVLGADGRCLYFSRSPIPYGRDLTAGELLENPGVFLHVGIYVYRRDALLKYTAIAPTPLERAEKLEQLRILESGGSIHAEITADTSQAVDTPEDLERVRALMQ
jgi:3-deoxy-manno-octulosonate cytidylyltransferase (CMP-KDO synthetase)